MAQLSFGCLKVLLGVIFFLFLGGAIAMLVMAELNRYDYENTEIHTAADCTLYNGWVYDTEYAVYAMFNASLLFNSEIVVWGEVEESLSSVKNALAAVMATTFPNKTSCFYNPKGINVESRFNRFLLNYDREELYAAYVGLAVAGSICLLIAVGSCIADIVLCCRRRAVNKTKITGTTFTPDNAVALSTSDTNFAPE